MEVLRDKDIDKVEAEHQEATDKRIIRLRVIGENRYFLRYFRDV